MDTIAAPPPSRLRRRLTLGLVLLGFLAILAFPGVLAWQQWLDEQRLEQRKEALALARAGKFAVAEPLLQRHAARDPEDVEVLKALAHGYLAAQNKPQAEDCLTRWLAMQPNDVAALRLRLQLYRVQRRHELALADTQRLLELEPNNQTLLRQLAGRYFETGRFAEAEQACLRSLEQGPGDKDMLALLAQVYRARGANERAAEVLEQMLRDDPRSARALLGRALLYLDMGQAEPAIPLLERYRAVEPKQERTALYHLSIALTRVGRLAEAEKARTRVRQLQEAGVLQGDSLVRPDQLDLQVRTAQALLVSGDEAAALDVLADVLRRAPAHAPAHHLLADYYEKHGQAQRAAEHRRQAAAGGS